jgi:hypothetical protein
VGATAKCDRSGGEWPAGHSSGLLRTSFMLLSPASKCRMGRDGKPLTGPATKQGEEGSGRLLLSKLKRFGEICTMSSVVYHPPLLTFGATGAVR